ncbi:hypothetical protein WICPIJ_006621 [Wickerhamomyces pijperi]|uniref:Uncharacterized protein n=1 Tax=Wickerhamomyces pijperi TaxID=599730 RepID=A0A9P8TKQ3_WICPI|nr:hypothetical protein WICPIJ_006621 [Wickerhamomyces pijperi]
MLNYTRSILQEPDKSTFGLAIIRDPLSIDIEASQEAPSWVTEALWKPLKTLISGTRSCNFSTVTEPVNPD